jgi:spore coat protein SA
MRIAIMSSGLVALPPVQGGAVEEYVFQLTKHLKRRGTEIVAFDRAAPGDAEKTIEVDGVPVHRTKSIDLPSWIPKYSYLHESLFGAAVAKSVSEFDVVHTNTVFVAYKVGRDAKPRRFKLIYTCHNPYWPSNSVHFGEQLIRRIETVAMRKSDSVIALNHSMKSALAAKAGVPDEKMTIVPNGVDTGYFQSVTSARTEKADRTILFVGRIVSVKGIHILLRAYRILLDRYQLRSTKLLIVGPFSGHFGKQSESNYARSMMKWASDHLPKGSYDFVGSVSRERLRELYGSADLFVLPSFAEAFPMVLIEAMAAGCPLIGARSGGIPDVIQENINGLMAQPGDSQDLADKIYMVLSDRNMRLSFSRRSRQIAETTYDWSVVAESILSVYRI